MALQITAAGQIHLKRWVQELQDDLADVLACHQCGADQDLTLVVEDEEVRIRCPHGHEWSDREVVPWAVRQVLHQSYTNSPVWLASPGQIMGMALPLIDEDQTLQPFAVDDVDEDDPRWGWECDTALPEGPALVQSMRLARDLANGAMLAEGTLFDLWHPAVGGDPVLSHMTTVVLALAIYAAAEQERRIILKEVSLEAVRLQLAATPADLLRALRPTGTADWGGRLRRVDAQRLDRATDQEWALWHGAALATVRCQAEFETNAHWSRSPSLSLVCRQYWEDDMTWYQGEIGGFPV
ncbi:hypothetical protein [Streptacidiphilus cavernicola]|uniref:Uncharacterized protein n=1 Tax=Streptacidiphilus cavernicola TaxID=3342716 RepID=A0ABV6VY81_9ACTN